MMTCGFSVCLFNLIEKTSVNFMCGAYLRVMFIENWSFKSLIFQWELLFLKSFLRKCVTFISVTHFFVITLLHQKYLKRNFRVQSKSSQLIYLSSIFFQRKKNSALSLRNCFKRSKN